MVEERRNVCLKYESIIEQYYTRIPLHWLTGQRA